MEERLLPPPGYMLWNRAVCSIFVEFTNAKSGIGDGTVAGAGVGDDVDSGGFQPLHKHI